MKSLEKIKESLKLNKADLFKRYPLKSLAIFGSYSSGNQNEKSDLDLLVEFNGKIGIRFIDLAEEIEQIVGLKVDLVSKNGVNKKYFQVIETELQYV